MEIRENAITRHLQEVAELGQRRADLAANLDTVTADLRAAVIAAAEAGATRSRVRELAQITQATAYQWLRAAGAPMRTRHAGDTK